MKDQAGGCLPLLRDVLVALLWLAVLLGVAWVVLQI